MDERRDVAERGLKVYRPLILSLSLFVSLPLFVCLGQSEAVRHGTRKPFPTPAIGFEDFVALMTTITEVVSTLEFINFIFFVVINNNY